MLGNPMLYYMLFEQEEEFPELFKVKADFADTMDRDHDTEAQYANFIAARCHEEDLPPFDAAAVGRIVDYSSWLAGDQQKLSTRFGEVTCHRLGHSVGTACTRCHLHGSITIVLQRL